MNTRVSIKNFRVFDQNGVSFNLRPFTILTGCNSSGKSSIIKALILLNEFLGSLHNTFETIPRVDFGEKPLSLLGNFETVLNKASVKKGVKTLSISYDVIPGLIGRPLTISLIFGLDDNDLKKNGFLNCFTISDSSGRVLWKGTNALYLQNIIYYKSNNNYWFMPVEGTNLSDFKPDFFAFCKSYLALKSLNALMDSGVTKRVFIKQTKAIQHLFNDLMIVYGKNHILSILETIDDGLYYNRLVLKAADNPELIDKAAQTNIIAYLPILEQLDNGGKERFAETVRNLYQKSQQMETNSNVIRDDSLIERIISDYQDSEYVLFSDYYRNLENEYLEGKTSSNLMDEYALGASKNTLKSIHECITFDRVFSFLCELSPDAPVSDRPDLYMNEEPYRHDLFLDFITFVTQIIDDAFSEGVCQKLAYVSSSRINVQRLYSFDNMDNFSYTLSECLEAGRVNNTDYIRGSFINKWTKEFKIGERFNILPVGDGLGLVLKIFHDINDKKGTLLADYGYGISQLVSILIEVETTILRSPRQFIRKPLGVNKTTGMINFDSLWAPGTLTVTPRTIVIEEPEIHLHPRFQSKLAEMFVDAMTNYGIQFIIETHSEYLIRKIQTLVAKKEVPLTKEDVSIIYVNEGTDVDKQKVRQIEIAEDGRLMQPFGPGFFDEADSLAMNLLMIKGGVA